MKIGLILHGGKSGSDKISEKFQNIFGNENVIARKTSRHGEAELLAMELAEMNLSAIVVCGGDGSLNQAVNGIMNSKNPNVPIAVWPVGTANDFVKSVSVPNSIESLKLAIEKKNSKGVTLGKISNNAERNYFFINVTDIGIGGSVAKDMQSSKRTLGSFLTYQFYIIKHLLAYRKKSIRFEIDGFSYENKVMNFVVANTKFFGGGLGISPDSNPFDDEFEVVVIGDVGLFDYMRFISKVRRCEKINYHKIQYLRGKKIDIETDVPMPIDMDGEFIGFSPLRIEYFGQVQMIVAS